MEKITEEIVYKQIGVILFKLESIEKRLDRVIKAMQDYDGLDEDFNPIGYEKETNIVELNQKEDESL